jgi:NAD(P)H-dependent FMN reductase
VSKTLLVVHHTPSPATRELLEAVLAGTHDPDIEGVDVEARPALAATIPDMLDADGYLFGTTANFGYMSGALKHYLADYPSIRDKASYAAAGTSPGSGGPSGSFTSRARVVS